MTSKLDLARLHGALSEGARPRLQKLETFASIASTNTYLMSQPPPVAARFRVAIADHQTSGRGRHDRRWLSAPGAGLYLSFSYTFSKDVAHLSSLTLAIGVAVIDTLQQLDIEGASLKWPNDIVADDGKLGGILTEVQSGENNGITVVTGIGINIDIEDGVDFGTESDWAQRAVGLNSITSQLPDRETLAGILISQLQSVFETFEQNGLAPFLDKWQQHDWLLGREVTVDRPDGPITGVASGVDKEGALIVETPHGVTSVLSGSIALTNSTGKH